MAIYEDNDLRILEFGKGDIRVTLIKENKDAENENGVAFMQDEIHEVGTYHTDHEGKSLASLPYSVWMIFNKVESVDVVIEALEQIKANLLGEV